MLAFYADPRISSSSIISPKRCLAGKKRGMLKEPFKNITPKVHRDDGWKPGKLNRELRITVDKYDSLGCH